MEQSEIVKGNAEVLYATAYELTIMLPNLALALLLDVIHIYPIILLPAVAPIQQFQLLRNFDAHACFIRQAKSNPKQFLAHRGIGSIVQNSKLCYVDTNKENGTSKCINCQNLQTILNQHLRTNVMMKSNGRRGN